jgi:site-specific DNA-cytosine methylase
MKVLVACEFSGIVREAFAKRGHDAWSCDLLPTEIPGQHIQGDVLPILNQDWDLVIAHPPCTYLAVVANREFLNNPERWEKRLSAMKFVYALMNAPIRKIAIENPKSVISSHMGKASQIIQPYMFGEPATKETHLWLKNLPNLKPTKIIEPVTIKYKHTASGFSEYPVLWAKGNRDSKERSKTFQGIANAMAEQWGGYDL